MKTATVIAALALLATTATAQPTSIPAPFTGAFQEGFETQSGTSLPCVPGGIFGGQATLCTPAGNGVYLTGGWGFSCSLPPHSGKKLCGTGGATSGGGIDIIFSKPPSKFGGYFSMNHSQGPDFTVWFYAGPTLVAGPITVKQAVDCIWYWRGWDMGSTGVDRIHLKSNYSSTGYLHMDDFEVDFAPTCFKQYGSGCSGPNGCAPDLTLSGCAVAGQQVTINVTNAVGGDLAFFLFGSGQGPLPMGAGCDLNFSVLYPVSFAVPVGGPSTPCNGSVSLTAVVPAGTVGATVNMQVFTNDTNGPLGFANSNGLEFVIQ